MGRSDRPLRRLALAGTVAVAVLAGGVESWQTAAATTRVLDHGDRRFDVLVQRRTESLDDAGGQLGPPADQPRLSAARAFSIARGQRQPGGGKPSVRLATFSDPDFPEPEAVGLGHRLHPVAVRVLVWVVVVPDVPVVDYGPNPDPPGSHTCPTYTPVDATAGKALGTWQHC
jgi:hypothetical protein